jgi:signal transduction histidine kinase
VGLWLALQHSILLTLDQELHTSLTATQHYLAEQQQESDWSNAQQEMAEDLDAVTGTALVRIAAPAGSWIFRSPGTEEWKFPIPPANTLPAAGTIQTVATPRHSIRLLSAPVSIGVLQIGLPLDQFENMQQLLDWAVLISSPFLIVLASAGGYWMSGRVLNPVHQLALTVRDIGANNLAERLPKRGTGDELDQLAEVINHMLTRLESAFRRIIRFTSDASHELRTPVAIIKTTAEVELMKVNIQAERAWHVVLKQTARVHQLIDDLLILARADTQPEHIAYELMDASAVIEDACQEMHILADAAGLQLRQHVAPDCTLFGDPEDVRRIILILVDNAIKYTRSPGLVEVVAQRSGSQGEVLTVIVRDTGSGITEGDLPYIFDRFYRVAKDRSRSTGGAGLGLAIARHLTERHKGSITVTSVAGTGSTFTLSLPLFSTLNLN